MEWPIQNTDGLLSICILMMIMVCQAIGTLLTFSAKSFDVALSLIKYGFFLCL